MNNTAKQKAIRKAWGEEIWKPCAGYENYYEVSSYGSIRSLRKNKLLKPTINRHGYLKVSLTGDNSYKTVNLHRLIALTFILNEDSKPQVNHKDGDKTNNHIDNLEWVTREQNMQHAHLNGLMNLPNGEKHHYYKVKSELHPRAKALINIDSMEVFGSIKDCAKEIGVKEGTLRGWLSEPRIKPTKIMYLDDYKNNNGWIRIESEEDLPKELIDCWFIHYDRIHNGGYSRGMFASGSIIAGWKSVTHYQPIVKPKKPIY